MEEKKSGDGEKGPRKKVCDVSDTWGLTGGPLATAASPLVPQGPAGILQTHQVLGKNVSEGHRGAGDTPDWNCVPRMLRHLRAFIIFWTKSFLLGVPHIQCVLLA